MSRNFSTSVDPASGLDLSADLGEGSPDEEQVWPLITSANVACGGHVGDSESMRHAARRARKLGVRLGAHPSYPDREHFGRRVLTMDPAALRQSLVEQISGLQRAAEEEQSVLHHVKPHGALYNQAHHDEELAAVVVSAIVEAGSALAIVCGATSAMAAAARRRHLPVIREAFADRRYNPDGSLVSRGENGALLTVGEAAEQARMLAGSAAVIARDGSKIEVPFDTICVHADLPGVVERLEAIRRELAIRRSRPDQPGTSR